LPENPFNELSHQTRVFLLVLAILAVIFGMKFIKTVILLGLLYLLFKELQKAAEEVQNK